jgi:hypothetical protein
MNEDTLLKQSLINERIENFSNQFSELINNKFDLKKNIILISTWIYDYFNFLDELKKGDTFLNIDYNHDLFMDNLVNSYPMLYSHFFDLESSLSESELLSLKNANDYYRNLDLMRQNLQKQSQELEEIFYMNQLPKLKSISKSLYKLLKVKDTTLSDFSIFNYLIKHLEDFYEIFGESFSKFQEDEGEFGSRVDSQDETIRNSYPDNIFTSGEAYFFFTKLYERIGTEKEIEAVCGYIFTKLRRKNFTMLKDIKHKQFIDFFAEYTKVEITLKKIPYKNQNKHEVQFDKLWSEYKNLFENK